MNVLRVCLVCRELEATVTGAKVCERCRELAGIEAMKRLDAVVMEWKAIDSYPGGLKAYELERRQAWQDVKKTIEEEKK